MYASLSDGTKLFYQVFGGKRVLFNEQVIEKPTLVFLHGGPGIADQTLYIDFWSKLSDVAEVVFVDMRGHGMSEGWTHKEKFNLRSWSSDINDFCKAVGIIDPIIAGFSFGGWVAIDYAINYSEDLGAVILCNTEAKIDNERRALAYKAKADRKGFEGDYIYTIVKNLTVNSSENSQLYIEHCIPLFSENPYSKQELSLCKKNELAWEVFDANEQYSFDFTKDLPNITCPMLILAGSEDPEHPYQASVELSEMAINSIVELHVIDGAGDPVYRDQPDETLNLIKKYIVDKYPNVASLCE